MSLDDMPFNDPDWPPEPALEREPRRCRRHQWAPSLLGVPAMVCLRCGRAKDEAVTRRNKNNRSRGKGTSAELAKYLGWQNVEGMNWPWDVQGDGGRLQSKRDALARGDSALVRLIEAIPYGTKYLRGVFHVQPRQRLISGVVTLGFKEWVEWHGWDVPDNSMVWASKAGVLIQMPLPTFADVHGGNR